MGSRQYKQGSRDFHCGRDEPPKTYFSDDYRGEWQRGYDEASAEYERLSAIASAEEDRWRYPPPSYRAMEALEQDVGMETASRIRTLVETMIAEAAEAT